MAQSSTGATSKQITGNTSVLDNLCSVCNEQITVESKDCLMISVCSHIFHRTCLEPLLSDSTKCPRCRKTFELSQLHKYSGATMVLNITDGHPTGDQDAPAHRPMNQNNSVATGKRETRGKSQKRTKAKAAPPKRDNNRLGRKNLFKDSNPTFEGELSFPARERSRIAFEESTKNYREFDGNVPKVLGNTESIGPESRVSVDYGRIQGMIEESLSRILQGLALSSNAATRNGNPTQLPQSQPLRHSVIPQGRESLHNSPPTPQPYRAQPVDESFVSNFLQPALIQSAFSQSTSQPQPPAENQRHVSVHQPQPPESVSLPNREIPPANSTNLDNVNYARQPRAQTPSDPTYSQQPPHSSQQVNENNGPQNRFDQNRFEPSLALRSAKILSIIQNWNIKFDGSRTGLSVDEFLYRVRALAAENFNNDFSVICNHLHILLTGKARDWFWGYHKRVESIEWDSFCAALRYQYKDFRSSFDIREEVRSRKMRVGESFETFYESINSLLDRLETPMPESELVQIVLKNLLPDIRRELLYVPIYTLAHLRKLVQMREHLLGEETFRRNVPLRQPQNFGPRRVAEIEYAEEIPVPEELAVAAIRQSSILAKCWNCEETGHVWENCLKDRTIFCYGCGAKNVYKPNCTHCIEKKAVASKNSYANRPPINRPQM